MGSLCAGVVGPGPEHEVSRQGQYLYKIDDRKGRGPNGLRKGADKRSLMGAQGAPGGGSQALPEPTPILQTNPKPESLPPAPETAASSSAAVPMTAAAEPLPQPGDPAARPAVGYKPAPGANYRGLDDSASPDALPDEALPKRGLSEMSGGNQDTSPGGVAQTWNAEEFAMRLGKAKSEGNVQLQRKLLTQVAESNYSMRRGKPPVTTYVSNEKCMKNRAYGKGKDPVVSFSQKSTIDAAMLISDGGRRKKVCALNFANGEQVGGGYKTGATAQEEDLCRRVPSLYTSLYNAKAAGHYPFGPCTCTSRNPRYPERYSDVLYTMGLAVLRGSEDTGYNFLRRNEQTPLSIVTAAAPNVNFAKELYDKELMYRTIANIFVAPVLEEPAVNTLILGAWGCGAFGCDPKDISELFATALSDGLGRLYSEVHFAIPEGPNADVFRDTFKRRGIKITDIAAPASKKFW